ncbi:hypothetical protein BDQ17DRAFT_1393838 [Cyathus striatus]|nr:hypothetical protein BDQ17DRAFT_1393838 [Cyathus striatus]
MAFPLEECQSFRLIGRLSQNVNSLDELCDRAYLQLQARDTPIRKNLVLRSLKEQNWALYYALIARYLIKGAEAIVKYSHLFRPFEGLYLTFTDQDTMEREIDLFVVTDSKAILRIGGSGRWGASLPSSTCIVLISVVLDTGTNDVKLLNDPLYRWSDRRVGGKEYDYTTDARSSIHFDDFEVSNAYRLLERYRSDRAVFNGTGAVTPSCIMSALSLPSPRVDCEGGLRGEYWHPRNESWNNSKNGFLNVVVKVKPTVLIGCSTSAGVFSQDLRPIIMPLSNPSWLVEATPKNILNWADGGALVAIGNPFGSVQIDNRGMQQGPNLPPPSGLGFGAIVSQSRKITDTMLIAGAQHLAALPPTIRTSDGDPANYEGTSLLPDFADRSRVNFRIGVVVAEQAVKEGSTQVEFGVDKVRVKAGEKV